MRTLDDYVQLHEVVEIHYYVDCYCAQFYVQDGQVLVLEGRGESIQDAISDLEVGLNTKSLKEWRSGGQS